ncbi:putative bifunctional methylthioribulose-1-phosphate dehydratase/enolase-phosphatase E1 1 [Camellia lanceoleosa]|uniref:Bifunctional methylthioribulose-1-phosphate dehydratase/enolase-phosphatase E1 1 n=1 Tax=Camellia lanceoleosa TaxID=1840588 RepID=A0ACC0HIX9_9ERIC|nr:putative bifunctional methylthioribulose-1-phosphate dehydratase/enolase-phosphatase E1 1 [Camellia lanceoleosa]
MAVCISTKAHIWQYERKYLCGFFNTIVGNKKETSSYVEISESVGVDRPLEILFVTDVYQEAIAAKAAEQGLGKTTIPQPMGDIETATKGSTPTTNVQDYNEAKGHAQVRMSYVEGLVDMASMDSQTEVEMVQSHNSNGLDKSSFHNCISTPWSGLFKSEIAKKKVVKNLKRYSVGYENDQL